MRNNGGDINIINGLRSIFLRRYPYVGKVKLLKKTSKFVINSSVEDFRINSWGGERKYTIDIINSLTKNDVFFDIGSSVGLDTILAGNQLPHGFVVSFEPDNEVFERLKINIQLNNLHNIVALKCAAGSTDRSQFLFSNGADNISPRITTRLRSKNTYKVKTCKIDTLIKKKLIPYPTVVKIDVEGFERQVLLGMNELLASKKKPRKIFIEIHPELILSHKSSVQDIIKFLLDKKYSIYNINTVHGQLLCQFRLNNKYKC